MATTTTKLALRKPDPDPSTGDFINVVTDINDSMDKLDAAVGVFVCTSGTRPTGSQRWDGREIYETDTRRNYMWSAALTTWLPLLVGRGANGPYLLGASVDAAGEGITNATTGSAVTTWRTRVSGDANPRFTIDTAGRMDWGAGPGATDVILSRTAANELSTGTGDAFKVSGDYVAASCNGINGAAMASGTDSTTSGTYVNWGGTTPLNNFSFTKRFASTRVRIDLHLTLYAVTNDAGVFLGVNLNSTDFDIAKLEAAAGLLGERKQVSGVRFLTGIPAGTYTVTGRWKRTTGTGTLTRAPDDWVSLAAMEVSN